MKIKANINGKVYTRSIREFTTSYGSTFDYITVDRVPYIVLMRNGQPDGLITVDTFLNSTQQEEVSA